MDQGEKERERDDESRRQHERLERRPVQERQDLLASIKTETETYRQSVTTGGPVRVPLRGPTHAHTHNVSGSASTGSTQATLGAEATNSRQCHDLHADTERPRSSNRMGSPCRKHSGFPRSRRNESPSSAVSDRLPSRRRERARSPAALRPRQFAIPATATSCPLYRPTGRPSRQLYSLSLSDRDPLRFPKQLLHTS